MNTYLFDFDGTLVDSMPTYVSIMLGILDENGISYDKDIVKIITPLGFIHTARYFVSLGAKMSEEEMILRMKERAIDAYTNRIQAKPGVIETVRALKNASCSLHVLTASPHDTLDPCLKRLGIFDLFENVWSCEDFSRTKSDPEIYLDAARAIGKPVDEILFLDDNLNADLTAKKAGMKVCGVYDESSKEFENEMRLAADFYIREFPELLSFVPAIK